MIFAFSLRSGGISMGSAFNRNSAASDFEGICSSRSPVFFPEAASQIRAVSPSVAVAKGTGLIACHPGGRHDFLFPGFQRACRTL